MNILAFRLVGISALCDILHFGIGKQVKQVQDGFFSHLCGVD